MGAAELRSGSGAGAAQASDHNPWLDLLRALAIGLVLLRHGEKALVDAGQGGEGFVHAFMMNGWVGVDLFFVLSGYLIASHLFKQAGSGGIMLRHYLLMRALRILPAYYAVLYLVAAGFFPFFEVDGKYLGVRIAYHVLLLQDYLPSNINVVFWSLGVEEKFYLLAPLLVGFLCLLKKPWQAAAVVLLLFLISPGLRTMQFDTQPAWTYPEFFQAMRSPFHMSLEPLLAGVAIAFARHRKALAWLPSTPLWLWASIAAFIGFMASSQLLGEITLSDAALQPAVIGLFSAAMVLLATGISRARPPAGPVVRAGAKLSYSLYLVHLPLIPAAMQWAGGSAALFWFIYLALSLVMALAIHFAVEQPFLRIKHELAMTLRNQKQVPQGASTV